MLERAQAVADQFGVRATPILITARQAGRAIVETARERRSEVIILGSQRKRRPVARFGRTVDYVLENATTEVLHNLVSAEYPVADMPVAVEGTGQEDEETAGAVNPLAGHWWPASGLTWAGAARPVRRVSTKRGAPRRGGLTHTHGSSQT